MIADMLYFDELRADCFKDVTGGHKDTFFHDVYLQFYGE